MGFGEIILLMAFALILFGPEELPRVARTVGKTVYELRHATGAVTKELEKYVQTAGNVQPGNANQRQIDLDRTVPFSDGDSPKVDDTVKDKNS